MTEQRSRLRRLFEKMGSLTRVAVLLGSLAVVTLLLLPIAWAFSGVIGLAACGFAFVLCAIPGLASLLVGRLFAGPQQALFGLLVGMFLRMVIPLAGCLLAYATNSIPAQGGLAFYLLAMYPIMLTVETILLATGLEGQSTEAHPQHG